MGLENDHRRQDMKEPRDLMNRSIHSLVALGFLVVFVACCSRWDSPVEFSDEKPHIDSITVGTSFAEPGERTSIAVRVHNNTGGTLSYRYRPNGGRILGSGSQVGWELPSTSGAFATLVTVSDKQGGSDTGRAEVTVSAIGAPTIRSIVIDPATPIACGVANISVQASDPEGRLLTFKYLAQAGYISPRGPNATWSLPVTGGIYKLTVGVSNGIFGVRQVAAVTVSSPFPEPGLGTALSPWYFVNVSDYRLDGRRFGILDGVTYGHDIVTLERVYVRSNGEHPIRGMGALGVHLTWSGGGTKVFQLHGPHFEGVESNGTPKLEWDDCEGAVFSDFGIVSLSQVQEGYLRIQLIEGDHGLTADDVVFSRTLSASQIKNMQRPVQVQSDPIPGETTSIIWLSLANILPRPLGSPTISTYKLTAKPLVNNGVNTGGSEFRDPGYPTGTCVNKVLVGLNVKHGDAIDNIQPVFRIVSPDGSLRGYILGDAHGGNGGGPPQAILAPSGYVVTGALLRVGRVVENLQLIYQQWRGGGRVGTQLRYSEIIGGIGATTHIVTCTRFGIGIHGRSGRLIDAFGFLAAN
jgi:hypothetical protein